MDGELTEHAGAEGFIQAMRPMWEPREVELNLILGIADRLRRGWRPERGHFLATLERDARPIAAVLRTPPHGFAVAEDAPGAGAAIARALAASGRHDDARSVLASKPCAEQFARAWAEESGCTTSLTMEQRILALSEVVAPELPPGRFRSASESDAGVIAPWFHDFAIEAMPHEAEERETMIAAARALIERGVVYLWETSEGPASMAQLARTTPNTITVTAVYTPPPLRGRGYASACVAAISQTALDSGKRYACLYTDASNPTSNAMYERVGYREVCESAQWQFSST